jgi:Flp pilus assembly pilin Flp
MIFARRGQSIVEYTMIVGILTVVLYYMGTSIKRGVQSLVKVTADQVGNQQNADQDFNDVQTGYMDCSTTETQETNNRHVSETGYIPVSGIAVYVTNTSYNESTDSMTNTITNGGFSPSNQ